MPRTGIELPPQPLSVQMPSQCCQHVVGIGTLLIILGLIHPQHLSVGVGENRRRHWKCLGTTRYAGVNTLVAQTKEVGHLKLSIRKHRGTESVLSVPSFELAGFVGTNRQDLYTTRIELGPKLFPSPQLGDTVRSPVGAEELNENWVTGEGR